MDLIARFLRKTLANSLSTCSLMNVCCANYCSTKSARALASLRHDLETLSLRDWSDRAFVFFHLHQPIT